MPENWTITLDKTGSRKTIVILYVYRLSGASYGQLCCVLCFTYEAIFLAVTVAIIYIWKPHDTNTT